MNKREVLIEKYAKDIQEKLNQTPDLKLLKQVTIGCGPSIYNKDSSTVSASDPNEVATVKNNFLIKKLGLQDTPELDKAIQEVFEAYGSSNKSKYRAVIYYLLTLKFSKEEVYN